MWSYLGRHERDRQEIAKNRKFVGWFFERIFVSLGLEEERWMSENELRQDKNMEYHTSIGIVACVKNCHVSSIVAVVAFSLLGHDSILLARRAIIGSLENYLSSFSCGHSARVLQSKDKNCQIENCLGEPRENCWQGEIKPINNQPQSSHLRQPWIMFLRVFNNVLISYLPVSARVAMQLISKRYYAYVTKQLRTAPKDHIKILGEICESGYCDLLDWFLGRKRFDLRWSVLISGGEIIGLWWEKF